MHVPLFFLLCHLQIALRGLKVATKVPGLLLRKCPVAPEPLCLFFRKQNFSGSVLGTSSHFLLARLGFVHTKLLTVKGNGLLLLRQIKFALKCLQDHLTKSLTGEGLVAT